MIHNRQMVSMSTASVVRPFLVEMDHRIDHANIRHLVSSNFFIMM